MVQQAQDHNALHQLGYKIFLDRYALKDMKRETLAVGDTVIVVVDPQTGQREIGTVKAINLPEVEIDLVLGDTVKRDIEHVDKPLETTPEQMMDRVARGVASVEKTDNLREDWRGKFRWLLDGWKFVPGGRILTAAGTDQDLTYYNCYVIPSPKDSREGIITTLGQMTEIMSRGGGVGINLSTLRPRHAYVKGVNGRSSGSVSWGALYSFVTGLIEQGGSRRGALMLILNDWHPDVFDFINAKREMGKVTNANISVGVSDKLMEAVKADGDWELVFPDTSDPDYDTLWDGDLETWMASGRKVIPYKTVKAREVWHAIIESAWASAEPGVWFRERSNKMANSWYFNPLISTNPCVTGDTRIYTDKGMIPAQELFDDETEFEAVIDGRFGTERSTTPASRVFMTGHKPVFKLQTEEGYSIRATADHRFMTPGGWVELQDLQSGDSVHILNRKGGFGREGSLEEGRTLGWLVGNDLVEPMMGRTRTYNAGIVNVGGRDEARLRTQVAAYGLVENKHQVPEVVFRGTEEMQRGFLQALFTADGSVQGTVAKALSVRLASSTLSILQDVQKLLGNFAIASRIYTEQHKAQAKLMPDGKGGLREYQIRAQHELVISRTNLVQFADEIGFLLAHKQTALREQLASYATGPRAESFTAKVASVTSEGIEPVYDLTEPLTHSFIGNYFVIHNCGEQPLGAFSVCNLGAINLAKFYDDAHNDVDWDALRDTVHYATRFLDNVIDTTPYFFEENRDIQQNGERRVGLGTMGIAELMVRLGVRYGSDESVQFIDDIYRFIAREAYITSAHLAEEKGTFPRFEAEKFLESGYMQAMDEDVRELVKAKGTRNVTLLTQAPTGCVAPDTLVSTSTGMTPIVELGDPNGQQWQLMTRDVHTDSGLRKTSHFYINGFAPVKKVTTAHGFNITATHNHRLRVVDPEAGYVWRRMDELQPGDRVVLKRNTLGKGETVELTPVEQGSRSMSKLPQQMTPAFAELLGYYMGDGYTKQRGGLHLVITQRDPDLLDYMQDLMRQVWGDRYVGIEERVGCWTANLTGYYIPRFFEANGMLKPAGNEGEGAAGAFIPNKVLQAGRECVAAFLRGLFEADGSIGRGTITLNSTSQKLVRQVQMALLGLGIVATIREMPEQSSRYGDCPFYELRLLNRREGQRFVERVGFISQRKRERSADLGTVSDRGDNIKAPALLQDFYATSQGLKNDVRQTIIGRVSNGAVTQQFVSEMVEAHPQLSQSQLAELIAIDVFIDDVATIEDGECHTYDISVPDNKTYIANGFVSHNTTGTMVNTSTGIEPFFSWVYYRKSRLGLHEEQVPLAKEFYAENPDASELPDYFVTAMDLSPTEHVRVQAAFQRWIDSAISKTCNVPREYTVEQVAELYEYMYDLGCKGGTIYRDGSRDEQVLMLKNEDEDNKQTETKAEQAQVAAPAQVQKKATPATKVPTKAAQVSTPHRVYPRPKQLQGITVKTHTPFGTAYITMNQDEYGYPFEVFITSPGKAGSDLQADAEGLGRMISLSLRTTAPQNRREMLKLVIEQLRGIGGTRSVGFGPQRVASLPDAVSRALEETFFAQEEQQQLQLPIPEAQPNITVGSDEVTLSGADMCPSCGTISLIRAEGCRKCLTCGYSEC